MLDKRHDYVAYLLRIWRANQNSEGADASTWHASLDPVSGGGRIGFADLTSLYRYLDEEAKRNKCETVDKERSVQDE